MSTQIPLIQRETFVKPAEWGEDVCESKHGGNPASVAAHEKVLPYKSEQQKLVYELMIIKAERGITAKEADRELHIGYTSASARLSELVRMGSAFDSPDPKREGCTVRKAKFAK